MFKNVLVLIPTERPALPVVDDLRMEVGKLSKN